MIFFDSYLSEKIYEKYGTYEMSKGGAKKNPNFQVKSMETTMCSLSMPK